MPGRKYTPEQIERAAELRERGASYPEIARATGMSKGAIYWHCLRVGADRPGGEALPAIPTEPVAYARSGHKVRRFTEAEDRRLLALEAQGKGMNEIARILGRKHNSVIGRLMTLARRDAREEAEQ